MKVHNIIQKNKSRPTQYCAATAQPLLRVEGGHSITLHIGSSYAALATSCVLLCRQLTIVVLSIIKMKQKQ